MDGSVALVCQSRTQAEIKIRRRGHSAQTSDHTSQLRLRPVKIATVSTLVEVRTNLWSIRVIELQFIELLTNYFAVSFSHNFFTYKYARIFSRKNPLARLILDFTVPSLVSRIFAISS